MQQHITQTGILENGTELNIANIGMHYTLPFATEFSPAQAFAKCVDGLPAGKYYVKVSTDTYGRAAGNYWWEHTSNVPAGAQLTGFFASGTAASVKVYADEYSTSVLETCTVNSGTEGTYLGAFSAAGDENTGRVPASGTPTATKTITVGSSDYHIYGLNSQQRVSYGNNRYLHCPLRQYLNAEGFNWYVAKTVFDRPPSYVARQGFLSGLPAEFLAKIQPVQRLTALNYVTDGGTSSAPLYDETYDLVSIPSGIEHFIADNASYGGGQGKEGVA